MIPVANMPRQIVLFFETREKIMREAVSCDILLYAHEVGSFLNQCMRDVSDLSVEAVRVEAITSNQVRISARFMNKMVIGCYVDRVPAMPFMSR